MSVDHVLPVKPHGHEGNRLVVVTTPDVVTVEPGDVIEHSASVATASPCTSTVSYQAAPCGAVAAAASPCVDNAGLPCASQQALFQATLAENEARIAAERATAARVAAEARRNELEVQIADAKALLATAKATHESYQASVDTALGLESQSTDEYETVKDKTFASTAMAGAVDAETRAIDARTHALEEEQAARNAVAKATEAQREATIAATDALQAQADAEAQIDSAQASASLPEAQAQAGGAEAVNGTATNSLAANSTNDEPAYTIAEIYNDIR